MAEATFSHEAAPITAAMATHTITTAAEDLTTTPILMVTTNTIITLIKNLDHTD